MPNRFWRYATEHISRTLGVALGVILLAAAGWLWAHPPNTAALLTNGSAVVTVMAAISVGVLVVVLLRGRRWQPPTALNLLVVLSRLMKPEDRMKLRFVATDKGNETAQTLATIFEHFGWEIEANTENASHIFSAKETFRGVRLRCRPSVNFFVKDEIETIIRNLLSGEYPSKDPFPDTDQF
jgi:hypothetical protein